MRQPERESSPVGFSHVGPTGLLLAFSGREPSASGRGVRDSSRCSSNAPPAARGGWADGSSEAESG